MELPGNSSVVFALAIVQTALVAAYVAYYGVLVARQVFSPSRRKRLETMLHFCTQLVQWQDPTCEDVLVSKYAAREVAKRCVFRARYIITLSGKLMCALTIPMIINGLTGRSRWMSLGQDIVHSVHLVFALLVSRWPQLVVPRTVDLCYVLLSAEVLVFSAASSEDGLHWGCDCLRRPKLRHLMKRSTNTEQLSRVHLGACSV